MRMYRWIGAAAVTGITALALVACGQGGGVRDQAAVEVAAELTTAGQALAGLGFQPADIEPAVLSEPPALGEAVPVSDAVSVSETVLPAGAVPGPSVSSGDSPGQDRVRPGLRQKHLNRMVPRRDTLHGEVVVQTKDGTKTVLVQRGEVTAVTDTTMTVKSTDGYSQVWTFGDPIRVVDRRTTVQPKDIEVGTQVGVAGTRNGDASTARLIVVPFK